MVSKVQKQTAGSGVGAEVVGAVVGAAVVGAKVPIGAAVGDAVVQAPFSKHVSQWQEPAIVQLFPTQCCPAAQNPARQLVPVF